MASQSEALVFTALARAVQLRLGDFNVQEHKLRKAHIDPQILAMLIWSSAQLQMLSKCLANTILKETRARIHEFSPCSLASIVWAFDELGILRLKLMQKLGAAASLLIEQFEAKEFLESKQAF